VLLTGIKKLQILPPKRIMQRMQWR